MSKQNVFKCDVCEETGEGTFWVPRGWRHIEVAKGTVSREEKAEVHVCSDKCFANWLRSTLAAVVPVERDHSTVSSGGPYR